MSIPSAVGSDEPSLLALPPTEMAIVGNGPLTTAQRGVLRHTDPSRIFRFNGMANLHPDEQVGHLFARLSQNYSTPREFWGVAPPVSALSILECLFLPFADVALRRTQCNRLHETKTVILIDGFDDDVRAYAKLYGLNVKRFVCNDPSCLTRPPTTSGCESGHPRLQPARQL